MFYLMLQELGLFHSEAQAQQLKLYFFVPELAAPWNCLAEF